MKFLQFCLAAVFVISFSSLVQAQDDPAICSAAYINDQVDEIVQTYQQAIASAASASDSLKKLSALQEELAALEQLCLNVNSGTLVESVSVGDGTPQNPYGFGVLGDTGEGFSLRITGYIRPADQIIRNENMFNDRPGAGEEYIILNVELTCHEDVTGRCEASSRDFELTGDSGTIYSSPYVVYDDELDVSVFAGGSGQGGLPFLIRSDDMDLRLLYKANMFSDDFVSYLAEPDRSTGVEITASANINIRNAPSTNAPVVGTLAAGATEISFGKNGNGTWLQIGSGWVFAELVSMAGDASALPVTAP